MSNKGNTKIVTNMLKRRKKLFKKLSTKPGLVRKCENPEKGTDQKGTQDNSFSPVVNDFHGYITLGYIHLSKKHVCHSTLNSFAL